MKPFQSGVWVLAGCLSGCGFSEDLPDTVSVQVKPEAILFQDVRLFDGLSEQTQEHMDVLVREGLIEVVRPSGEAVSPGVEVVPGQNRTLLPGLIDAHTHLTGTPAPPWDLFLVPPEDLLQSWLAAGVTTIVDMGGKPKDLVEIRRAVQAGEIASPRLFLSAGPVTVSGGHPIPGLKAILPWPLDNAVASAVMTATSPEQMDAHLSTAVSAGLDIFKIVYDSIPAASPHMNRKTLEALVAKAHAVKLPVAVHIGSPQDAIEAVEAGADILAHGAYKEKLTPDQAEQIARAGVPVIVTSWIFEAHGQMSEGKLQATRLDKTLAPARALDPALGPSGLGILEVEVLGGMARTGAKWRQARRENVRLLAQAGVPVLTGSDSPFFGVWPGASLHRELEELVLSGMSPAQALLGATSRAAQLLEDDPAYGTIRPGRIADLLLVEGDPVSDIRATQDIVMVLQAGKKVELLVSLDRH